MPKLKLKSDGGYFTTTVVDGSFVTYQITQEGVSILSTLGYKSGDNFEKETLQRLINSKYAYVQGTQQTVECYDEAGNVIMIAKPQKDPDVYHETFGWGWVHRDPGEIVEVLFLEGRRFAKKTIISNKLQFGYNRYNYADLTKKYYKAALSATDPEVKLRFAVLALDALDDRLKKDHIKKYEALKEAIRSHTGHSRNVTKRLLKTFFQMMENLSYGNKTRPDRSINKAMKIVGELIQQSGYDLD